MKLPFLFFILLLASACSDHGRDGGSFKVAEKKGIVEGSEVAEGSALSSYVVLIYVENETISSGFCTGTFIARDLILTAAHCVNEEDVSKMGVSFGAKPLTGASTSIELVSATRIPKIKDGRNDLAVVRFKGGLPAGAKIANLPRAAKPGAKFSFTALGYGRTTGVETSGTDLAGAGELRKGQLTVENWNETRETFEVSQKMGSAVCSGDSGGPALIKSGVDEYTIVGVASGIYSDPSTDEYAEGFDGCKQNSKFMNVLPALGWIKSL